MKSTRANAFQIKRLDLKHEGVALQKAVNPEMEWVRRSVMEGPLFKIDTVMVGDLPSIKRATVAVQWTKSRKKAAARKAKLAKVRTLKRRTAKAES